MSDDYRASDHVDCLVVGGGIIGLSIADSLANAGKTVSVVDHRPVDQIASWAAAGILPPPVSRALHDPLEQLRELSHEYYAPWLENLRTRTGVDLRLEACGGLYLGRTAGEKFTLQTSLAEWERDGVRVERLRSEELPELEPHLARLPAETLVYRLPDEVQVRPNRILKALQTSLQRRGIEIQRVQTPVTWDFESDRAQLTVESNVLSADQICIATGPWTGGRPRAGSGCSRQRCLPPKRRSATARRPPAAERRSLR